MQFDTVGEPVLV